MLGLNFKIHQASSSYCVRKGAYWNLLIHVKCLYEVEKNLLVAENDLASVRSFVTYFLRLSRQSDFCEIW